MIHRHLVLLSILLLSLAACRPTAPTPAPAPRSGRPMVSTGAPCAHQTVPATTPRTIRRPTIPPPSPIPSPSPTALGRVEAATLQPPPADEAIHAFHINLLMDETITCPGEAPCDAPFLPRLNLYFRANVEVAADGALHGEGTILWADVSACETLMPGISSCDVDGATSGSFAVTGRIEGGALEMTLHLEQAPGLSATMVTQGPNGPITIPFGTTYDEEIGQLLEEAHIFGVPITGTPELPARGPVADFEGSVTFGNMRTLHGYGGMFFVSPDMPIPEPWQPES